MSRRPIDFTLAIGIVASALLLTLTAFNTTNWIGTTFPGFFLLENRVVPSISLPHWGAEASELFQHQVVAVDGNEVRTSKEIYAYVAGGDPGSVIRYTLRAPDGTATVVEMASRQFSFLDYSLIFGAYLFCALVFTGTGFLVFWLRPDSAASAGLLSACLGLGFYALTGADLYGPHWLFRLHVVAECLFPAGIIHLALVFPTNRLSGARGSALTAIYLPFVLLTVVYQCVLYWPGAYSTLHLVASAAQGLSGVALLAAVIYDRFTTDSALVRWRIGIVGAGAVTAFIGPAVLTGSSGLFGGSVPVNGAAFTAFIFPFSLGFAILRRDLLQAGLFAGWKPSSRAVSSWLERLDGIAARVDSGTGGRAAPAGVIALAVLSALVIGITVTNSTDWVDRKFPGFLVMENRVVPSVSLSHWDETTAGLFQHQVVAVDGRAVHDSAEIYALVDQRPTGTDTEYTLRTPSGDTTTATLPTARFTKADYYSLFGPFLLTGGSFIVVGFLVFFLQSSATLGGGMLSLGLIGGTFVLTAVDLYGPHWFFRLHAACEALAPAALIHFALVFPSNRLQNGYRAFLFSVYLGFAAMAVLYQVVLHMPTGYSAMHLASVAAQGFGGLAVLWVVTYDLLTTTSDLVRQRVLVVALGTFVAFLLPTVVSGATGFSEGSVAVNSAAVTGFLMPMSLAYAMVRRRSVPQSAYFSTSNTRATKGAGPIGS